MGWFSDIKKFHVRKKYALKFSSEIAEASQAYDDYMFGEDVTVPGPFVAAFLMMEGKNTWHPSQGFWAFVTKGRPFKWVLTVGGDLVVVAPMLKHSVAAGGQEVWSAGMGKFKGAPDNIPVSELILDNDTGHYGTSVQSLETSKAAWETLFPNVTTQKFGKMRSIF